VQLHYLDWQRVGPAIVLIHGLGDNPYVFEDLAASLADRFRIVAYSRRGHGRSEIRAPYDTGTLTEDLRSLMDELRIAEAHLVGWSMGGNEATAMAATYPNRVRKLVYFDGGFDYADPAFAQAFRGMPPILLETPVGAMASFEAYRAFKEATEYTSLDDMGRVERYLREVVTTDLDGTLRLSMAPALEQELLASLACNPRREYEKLRLPVLALYASSIFDPHTPDIARRNAASLWESTHWRPFREASINRLERELKGARIVEVEGTHNSFFLTSRDRVIELLTRFLGQADSATR
jgi:pimeloyl-ACP methyl ester carboxylesterase